jgi:hypothetical protein
MAAFNALVCDKRVNVWPEATAGKTENEPVKMSV